MAGVILETLSNRKLIVFAVVLFLVQAVFFLVGGLIAPRPYNIQSLLSNICLDDGTGGTAPRGDKTSWLYPRPLYAGDERVCRRVEEIVEGMSGEDIVFAFQYPIPRENSELPMSRLHQNMLGVVMPTFAFLDEGYDTGLDTVLTVDARLGGWNRADGNKSWTELARSTEERPLKCTVYEGKELTCDLLPLFELGSVVYEFYLLNIRVPMKYESKGGSVKNVNEDIGKLKEFNVHVIHQNGGFTLVWFSVKTIVFPIVAAVLFWFIWRVAHLNRKPNVLEQTLMALGIAMTLLNIPVDWLTLWLHMPFMILYSDIRQGLFYSVLLCFWVIFAGEHMMDQLERNYVGYYWKHLSAVGFGCICLFVFEMCERGVQLTNPFCTIWATTTGQYLGLTFIILAGVAAGVYFIYLLSMVVRVFRNIVAKKSALPSMSKPRRKFYMSLIYRFSFLMVFTLVCAAMTVVLFILGQVSEGHWKWGDQQRLEYTSAVQTGVYGMWNIYVFSLLILYAPSNKYIPVAADEGSTDEQVEFSTLPSEASVLTNFAQKTSAD